MKWTQEQRDKACILIFAKSGMPKSSVELSNVAMDVCIDLACQRNELLEIAQFMVADEAFADLCAGIGEEPRWLKLARAAISKAEGE